MSPAKSAPPGGIARLYVAALDAYRVWEKAERAVLLAEKNFAGASIALLLSDDPVRAMTSLRIASADHLEAVKSAEYARRYYKEHEAALFSLR